MSKEARVAEKIGIDEVSDCFEAVASRLETDKECLERIELKKRMKQKFADAGKRPRLSKATVMVRVLRFLNLNYSSCEKCGLPWNWCKSKSVNYSENSGTFATCDVCWNSSTLPELKQYYTNVYKKQVKSFYGTDYKIEYTLEHLLECVESEYSHTHGIKL